MLEWIPRGLGKGRVTTRYPARPELAPPGYRGRVELRPAAEAEGGAGEAGSAGAEIEAGGGGAAIEALCPTGAIEVGAGGRVRLDRGRCILCGACVEALPQRFAFAAGAGAYETASRTRSGLVAGAIDEDDPQPLREALGERVRALRRSIHIRHVDAGSDGAEEWEIVALTNPYYDIQRLGLYFTAAPRHADVLLVTGGVTEPLREPLRRAWEVMPEPKAVIAAGTDACSGGLSAATGLTMGGVDRLLPVDVYVPGSPPAPIALLHGLLLAVGVVAEGRGAFLSDSERKAPREEVAG